MDFLREGFLAERFFLVAGFFLGGIFTQDKTKKQKSRLNIDWPLPVK